MPSRRLKFGGLRGEERRVAGQHDMEQQGDDNKTACCRSGEDGGQDFLVSKFERGRNADSCAGGRVGRFDDLFAEPDGQATAQPRS